jgi:nucleoside-diphosphate-sugar epimerase
MLLVTDGAGFIGSNVVADLNEAGRTDIAVNDRWAAMANGATCRSANSPISCRRPISPPGSMAAS